MEDISLPQPDAPEKQVSTPYCIHCNVVPAVPGFATNLCADCRHNFNHYPIPKWIWFFAAVVAVLMVGGLIRMPSYIQAVAHLKRAERAIDEHKYFTARNEAKQVLKQSPDMLEANAYWLIGSAYTLTQPDLGDACEKLKGRDAEDTALYNKVTAALLYVGQFVPGDSVVLKSADRLKDSSMKVQLQFFDALNGDSVNSKMQVGYLFAESLYERKEYANAITFLHKTLAAAPNSYGAKLLLVAALRQTGDYVAATALCESLLKDNQEDVDALSQLAKISLKKKDDKTAMMYATRAAGIGPDDLAVLEVRGLVSYFTGQPESAKAVLQHLIHQEVLQRKDSSISTRLANVLNGVETYR